MSNREWAIAVIYVLMTAIDALCIGMMIHSDSDTAIMWALIAIPLSTTILSTLFSSGKYDDTGILRKGMKK